MGGRGTAGRAIAQHAARDGVSDYPLLPEDEPPTEQVPADPPAPEPAETSEAETPAKQWAPETVVWDGALYDAIEQLGGRDRNGWPEWVSLTDLRPLLGGTRDEQDTNLKRLSREGIIHLTAENDRKALRQTDFDAEMTIGGEPCHLAQWDYYGHRDRPEATP